MSELDEPPFDTDTRRAVTALERGGRIAGSGLRLRTILFELCSRNPIWAEAVADVSAMLNARGEVEVGLENATNEVDMRYEVPNSASANAVLNLLTNSDGSRRSPEFPVLQASEKSEASNMATEYSRRIAEFFKEPAQDVRKELFVLLNIIQTPDLLDMRQTTPGAGSEWRHFFCFDESGNLGSERLPSMSNVLAQEYTVWLRRIIHEYIASRTLAQGDMFGQESIAMDPVCSRPTTVVMGSMSAGKSGIIRRILDASFSLMDGRLSNHSEAGSLIAGMVGMPRGFDLSGESYVNLIGYNPRRHRGQTAIGAIKPPVLVHVDASRPDRLVESLAKLGKTSGLISDARILTEHPAFWDRFNMPKAFTGESSQVANLVPSTVDGPYVSSLTLSLLKRARSINCIFACGAEDVRRYPTRRTGYFNQYRRTRLGDEKGAFLDSMKDFCSFFSELSNSVRWMALLSAVFDIPIHALTQKQLDFFQDELPNFSMRSVRDLCDPAYYGRTRADLEEATYPIRIFDKHSRRTIRGIARLYECGMIDYAELMSLPDNGRKTAFVPDASSLLTMLEGNNDLYGIGEFVARLNRWTRNSKLGSFITTLQSLSRIYSQLGITSDTE